MKNLFFNPKNKVKNLNLMFAKLAEQLPTFKESKTPFEDIVDFFQLISFFQDEGLAQKVLSEIQLKKPNHKLVEPLERFVTCLNQSGRYPYGMNRTNVGETVTASKVYIGGTHGINTLLVSEWKLTTDDASEIAEGICCRFVQTNSTVLLTAIADIKKIVA